MGVSRVAVWKQINALKELGYEITSTPKGYQLAEDRDHLYSWEFSQTRENYHAYPVVNSTMEKAAAEAEKNCPSFTTVVSETQTGGKGRGDRKWISPEGGLYFTWVIRPELPIAYHYIYTLGAAAALCRTSRDLWGIELATKWPNDVYYKGKKASGILTEMKSSGDSLSWLNLGMGINVNNDPHLKSGISLSKIAGRSLDRKEILTSLENNMKNLLRDNNPREIRNLWTRLSCTTGSKVKLQNSHNEIFEGDALALDASGALIVKSVKGKEQQALFGDLYIKKEET